jgi:hypothetical protein
MSKSLEQTEAIAAAGATAPRVSLADIKAAVSHVFFFTAAEAIEKLGLSGPKPAPAGTSLMTICVMQLSNGFIVLGKSAPASPENFDPEKGKTFSYDDCIHQLWPLMGFALREKLYMREQFGHSVVAGGMPSAGGSEIGGLAGLGSTGN